MNPTLESHRRQICGPPSTHHTPVFSSFNLGKHLLQEFSLHAPGAKLSTTPGQQRVGLRSPQRWLPCFSDMYDQVLKFGAYIVDGLRKYRQPVLIYIPPHAEVRGGSWAVMDASINPLCIEIYADRDSRWVCPPAQPRLPALTPSPEAPRPWSRTLGISGLF